MSEKYTESQIDGLKELINIGGGHAATSISKMIDTRVSMDVPYLERMSYTEIFTTIMPEEQFVKAVLVPVEGEMEGLFLFIVEAEDSDSLVQKLMKPIIVNEELAASAICEFVNILVNSYLNAVADFLGSTFHSSVPIMVEDLFGALLSSAYLEEEQYEEQIYIVKNEFLLNGMKLESSLYFVPKVGILEKFIKKITLI